MSPRLSRAFSSASPFHFSNAFAARYQGVTLVLFWLHVSLLFLLLLRPHRAKIISSVRG